jgi:glucose-1-phosphate cytidylyltransferase
MTYCDGLSNIKISELLKKHKNENKLVTVTAVNPQHRYGILKIKKNLVIGFNNENPKQNIFINGGFFIINPKALKYIKSNYSFWEKEPMETFIKNKQLSCYVHKGFWASLDTQKDKIQLNKLWKSGKAQWI